MGKLDTAVWQRSAHGQNICGDKYLLLQEQNLLTIALVDGLGHGAAAAEAAAIAIHVLENSQTSLPQLIPIINQRLIGTTGVVLGVARINLQTHEIYYIGIGNISTCLLEGNKVRTMLTSDGFLGGRLPFFRQHQFSLGKTRLLVMTSDGIASFPGFKIARMAFREAASIAEEIGQKWGLEHDDRTVLVVKLKET